jgi:hypothetical protein
MEGCLRELADGSIAAPEYRPGARPQNLLRLFVQVGDQLHGDLCEDFPGMWIPVGHVIPALDEEPGETGSPVLGIRQYDLRLGEKIDPGEKILTRHGDLQ